MGDFITSILNQAEKLINPNPSPSGYGTIVKTQPPATSTTQGSGVNTIDKSAQAQSTLEKILNSAGKVATDIFSIKYAHANETPKQVSSVPFRPSQAPTYVVNTQPPATEQAKPVTPIIISSAAPANIGGFNVNWLWIAIGILVVVLIGLRRK